MTRYVLILFLSTLPACVVQTETAAGESGPQGPPGEKGPPGEPGTSDAAAIDSLKDELASLKTTIAELQKSNADLQAKVDALEDHAAHPVCPPDYVPTPQPAVPFLPDAILCVQGVDEVVRVGQGRSAFWIDRYEATIWETPTGSGVQYFAGGTDDTSVSFPKNGQATLSLYALSVAGRKAAASVTWFQAAEACAAAGKRLPTSHEWQRAASGTIDPGAVDGSAADDRRCNTASSGPRDTGSALGSSAETSCVSRWGAEDMIGNLWEWTADWHVGVGDTLEAVTGKQSWPDDPTHPYGQDGTWNVASSVYSSAEGIVPHLPSVAVRGGGTFTGVLAGVFAFSVNNPPSSYTPAFGFRCVVP